MYEHLIYNAEDTEASLFRKLIWQGPKPATP